MSEAARVRNTTASSSVSPGSESARLTLRRPNILTASELVKSYYKGKLEVPVLRGASLTIAEGEFTAIVGQSGCGKSTLLHLLGTLDQPDRGEVWLGDQCISRLKPLERDRLRNRKIGLIFQFYHLLPELTTLENVLVPRMIRCGVFSFWKTRRQYTRRATELLERVGLGHRLRHRPRELSGGEMQRAAIARALITRPKLLLADEPTGNLDQKNGRQVIQALMELQREEQITIVMVTHDEQLAKLADRTIRLVEGRVEAA